MKNLLALFVGVTVLLFGSATTQATVITYDFTTTSTITGSLNGVAFTDKTFTMTQTGNSADVVYGSITIPNFGLYEFYTLAGAVSITIDGVGSATFISPTDFRATSVLTVLGGAVGFGDWSGGLPQGIGVQHTSPTFYDLTTPFSIVYTGDLNLGTGDFYTSVGDLIVTEAKSDINSYHTFTATAVPEPSTMAFAVFSTGWTVVMARRRRNRISPQA